LIAAATGIARHHRAVDVDRAAADLEADLESLDLVGACTQPDKPNWESLAISIAWSRSL
jgi:hypothetical protein